MYTKEINFFRRQGIPYINDAFKSEKMWMELNSYRIVYWA